MEKLLCIGKNNILKLITIFVFAIICLIGFSTIEASSDYSINNYRIDAMIKKDGSMHIEEYLEYSFDDNMNGVMRDILYQYTFKNQKDSMEATSTRYQSSGIKNLSVYASQKNFLDLKEFDKTVFASNGKSGVYTVENKVSNGYRKYIKVYYPVKDGSKVFVKYSYDLEKVVVKYNDMSEIYWNFIGGDWEDDLKNININISFESATDLNDIQVYPHSYGKINETKKTNNIININSKYLSSGTALDARVVFPSSLTPNATKIINKNYDYNELKRIENKMSLQKKLHSVSNYIYVIVILIVLAIFIVTLIKVRKELNKRVKKYKDIDYYRDIPDSLNLEEYNFIINRYGQYSGNLMLSTILDLVHRKYITMDAQKNVKKSIVDNLEYKYYMTLDKSKDLSKLTEYEITLVNILFNEEAEKNTDITKFKFDKIELNQSFKNFGKKYTKVTAYYSDLTKKAGFKMKEKYEYVNNSDIKRYIIIAIICVVILFINTLFISPLTISNKMPIIMVVLVASVFFSITTISTLYACAYKIKDEFLEEYYKLVGLKKYLGDYSKIKDRFPIEIVLWDRYLVFATLFGIADKVSKEFKDELIAQGYTDENIYHMYPILNMSIYSMAINNSISYSGGGTGSSSSGGFSGGGGGGGGRRWWRWRCFLASSFFCCKIFTLMIE